MTLIKVGEIEFEAAEANGLKGYRKRVLLEGYDWGSTIIARKKAKATHHRGRPKGGAVKQCKENIDQRGNEGKR